MKAVKCFVFIALIGFCAILNDACAVRSARETPVVAAVKKYAGSVVNIRTETVVDLKESPQWGLYGEQLDDIFERHFGEDYSGGLLRQKSLGSGVILDENGFVVTNAHVIQKATSIFVVLKNGTTLKAKLVKVSQEDDLAMIKMEQAVPAEKIAFADMNDLMVGESVIAIGNPFGLENSVTVGVLSGKDRAFESQQCSYVCSGLLQIDASINPGSSGGALLNLDGELVGVNMAVVQHAQSIGFAVPADKVKRLLKDVQKDF
jgi:serine protease Do